MRHLLGQGQIGRQRIADEDHRQQCQRHDPWPAEQRRPSRREAIIGLAGGAAQLIGGHVTKHGDHGRLRALMPAVDLQFQLAPSTGSGA